MQHRFDTIRKVEITVKKAFGEKYIIRVFGSTCYGADTEASDLDLVVMVGKSLKLSFNLLDEYCRIHRVLWVMHRTMTMRGYYASLVSLLTVPDILLADPVTL
jgi:predicted nucleotidyltransferase